MQGAIETLIADPIVYAAILAALSLRVAVGFFDETRHFSAKADLWLRDVGDDLSDMVIGSLENESIRTVTQQYINPNSQQIHVARQLAGRYLVRGLWEHAVEGRRLVDAWDSFQRWESRGKAICQFGTFLNLGVLFFVFVLSIITIGELGSFADALFVIFMLLIVMPIALAAGCWLFFYLSKRNVERIVGLRGLVADGG